MQRNSTQHVCSNAVAKLAALAVWAGIWMAASPVCLGSQDRLTVAVMNYADVETGLLERAADFSRDLLQRAGIESTWLVCPRPDECALPPVGTYVRMIVAKQTMGPVLGMAMMDTLPAGNPQVYAFREPVVNLALRTNYPISMVLAAVMAHETLHLFGLQHTKRGIMRPSIDKKELADLGSGELLVPGQVQQVREGLSRLQPTLLAAR
jgi:hypothetical protein